MNNHLHQQNGYILTFLASRIDLLLFFANSSTSIGRISSTASSAISLIAFATFKAKRLTSLSGRFGLKSSPSGHFSCSPPPYFPSVSNSQ